MHTRPTSARHLSDKRLQMAEEKAISGLTRPMPLNGSCSEPARVAAALAYRAHSAIGARSAAQPCVPVGMLYNAFWQEFL